VKHRYRSAQVKAAVKVNGEKLLFNWQMGRDLVQKKAEEHWGAGVVEQVSLDLRREFPQEDGFSARNLHYMKQWYLYYTTEASKLQTHCRNCPHDWYRSKICKIATTRCRIEGRKTPTPRWRINETACFRN